MKWLALRSRWRASFCNPAYRAERATRLAAAAYEKEEAELRNLDTRLRELIALRRKMQAENPDHTRATPQVACEVVPFTRAIPVSTGPVRRSLRRRTC